jgi:hypothetical protein
MEEMRIDIVDNFIAIDECNFLTRYVKGLDWNIKEYDVYDDEKYLSGMSANLDAKMRESYDNPILNQAEELTGKKFNVIRAYVNAWKANEPSFPHIDACHTTCLIYLNYDYDLKYGGETIFYTDDREAQYAITPKPGRAVFFDGNILHRASSFNNLYNDYRHTIAYKLGDVSA